MDLEAARIAVEQACSNLYMASPEARRQAEQVLLDFRMARGPFQACQYILERSQVTDARFQAIIAMREAAVREWALLSPQERQQLRTYLVHYLFHVHSDAGLAVVVKQIEGTLAVLLKRGWTEATPEDKAAVFSEVDAAAAAAGHPSARRIAMEVLEAIVTEFAPATARSLGMSWDYHDVCRQSLETAYLSQFFAHAATVARESAQGALSAADPGTLESCLSLLCSILAWDFRAGPRSNWEGRPNVSDSPQIHPPPSWRATLLTPGTWDWLPALYAELSRTGRAASVLGSRCRQLIAALASVTGEVFKGAAVETDSHQAGLMRQAHCGLLLRAALSWVLPLDRLSERLSRGTREDLEEMLDCCRTLSYLALIHGAVGFDASVQAGDLGPLAAGVPPQGPIRAVTELFKLFVSHGCLREEHLLYDACGHLMEAMVSLASPTGPNNTTRVWGEGGVTPEALVCAREAFRHVVEWEMTWKEAHPEELEEEENDDFADLEAEEDPRLPHLQSLGRAAPEDSLTLLGSLMATYSQRIGQGGASVAVSLDQLSRCVELCGAVLADSVEGETAMVPLSILQCSQRAQEAGAPDPVVSASRALFSILALATSEEGRARASPFLMETAAAAAGRWAETFLMPYETQPLALAAAFGSAPGEGGQEVLSLLIRSATGLIAAWPTEPTLVDAVARKLLSFIGRKPNVCRVAWQLPEWRELAGAFSQMAHPFGGLPGRTLRSLSRVLLEVTGGMTDVSDVRGYTLALLAPTVLEVRALASRPDLAAVAQRGGAADTVSRRLQVLRGAARGCTPRSQSTVWGVVSSDVLPSLCPLLEAFKHDPSVCYVIVKLLSDVCFFHIPFLNGAQFNQLSRTSLELLQLYSRLNLGVVSFQRTKASADARDEDRCSDLRALMKLLLNLVSRDMVDEQEGGPAGAGAEAQVPVSDVAFLGLQVLLPLVDRSLLDFPEIAKLFFGLLQQLMGIYTDTVLRLPEGLFMALMQALEYGLFHQTPQVDESAVEALAELFRHVLQQARAPQGTPPHTAALLGPRPEYPSGPVYHFMERLLAKLLMEDASAEVVMTAADALLPMILVDPSAYQKLGEALLQKPTDEAARAALIRSLNHLMGNGLNQNANDRSTRKQFRANLRTFVSDVRGIVRIK